jgi:WD40 repeat protein
VRSDNARWREIHLSDLQRQAARWQAEGRRQELLLAGGALDAATTWLTEHEHELTDGEREFWAASLEARRAHRRQRRAVTVTFVSIVLAVALAGATAAALFAIGERRAAERHAADAQRNAADAELQAAIARSRQLAVVATTLADERSESALLLALEGVRAAPTHEALTALAANLTRPTIRVRERWVQEGADASDLAFSPEGQIVTLGFDGTVRRFGLADGTPRRDPLTGAVREVEMAVLSPEGRLLATDDDGMVRLTDTTSGESRGQAGGSGTRISGMSFSPDESLLAVDSQGRVQLWDVPSWTPRGQPLVVQDWTSTLASNLDSDSIMAFNHDTSLLATVEWGETGGAVQLWDVASGRRRHTLSAPEGTWIWSVAFSPDATLIATGGEDGVVRLWDVREGEARGQLQAGRGIPVTSLAFGGEGQVLVTGDAEGTARLWDVEGRLPLDSSFAESRTPVAVASAGDLVASADEGGTLRLWEIVEIEQPLGAALLRLEGLVPPMVMSMAFSPDGSLLASGRDDGTVRLWEVAAGDPHGELLSGDGEGFSSVAFGPEGSELVAVGWDDAVLRWDLGELAADPGRVLGPPGEGAGVALSPDGTLAASGGEDGTVRLWDVATAETLVELRADEGAWVSVLGFSPDGSLLAAADGETGTVRVWDAASGEPRGELLADEETWVSALAFDPDASLLAVADADGVVRLLEVASGERGTELRVGEDTGVSVLAFSPDGALLAVGVGETGTVELWDVASGEARSELRAEREPWLWALVFSSDGSLVAAAGDDGVVRLWDVATGDLRDELFDADEGVIQPEYIDGLAISPDGSSFVSVSSDTGRLWDAATGDPRGELLTSEAGGPGSSVRFSADGGSIVSWGEGHPVRLWDVTTGELRGEVLRREEVASSTVVSPDGSLVVTSSEDGTVRSWDVATGELRDTIQLQEEAGAGPAISELAAVAPDGTRLVALAGNDLQLWDLGRGEAIEALLPDIVSYAMSYPGQTEMFAVAGTEGVTFSPDGEMILAWGWDGPVHVWEAATGRRVLELTGSPGETLDVATVVLHGDRVVSIHWDGSLRLWDADTGEPRGRIETGQETWVSAAAFDLHGAHAVTAADDGSLRVLPSDPSTWIRTACETVSRNLSLAEWHARIGPEHEYVRTCANHPSGAGAPPDAEPARFAGLEP